MSNAYRGLKPQRQVNYELIEDFITWAGTEASGRYMLRSEEFGLLLSDKDDFEAFINEYLNARESESTS